MSLPTQAILKIAASHAITGAALGALMYPDTSINVPMVGNVNSSVGLALHGALSGVAASALFIEEPLPKIFTTKNLETNIGREVISAAVKGGFSETFLLKAVSNNPSVTAGNAFVIGATNMIFGSVVDAAVSGATDYEDIYNYYVSTSTST